MSEPDSVSLREYLETLLAAQTKLIEERHAADQAALIEAKRELEARLTLLNELRGDVLTRREYDSKHEALAARLNILEQWKANIVGRTVAIGLIAAILIAAVGALIGHLFA